MRQTLQDIRAGLKDLRAGQQAYVTATGGSPGSGLNPNYLLVAALGPCSSISSSIYD